MFHPILTRLAFEDEELAIEARNRVEQKQELSREKAAARAEVARLTGLFDGGKLYKETRELGDNGRETIKRLPDPRMLYNAKNALEAVKQREALLRSPVYQSRLTAVRAEQELVKYNGKELVDVERPKLPLGKNELKEEALPRFRKASLDIVAEIKETEKAPNALGDVEKRAHAEVDKIADRGMPKTLRMFTGNSGIDWPTHDSYGRRTPDGLSLVAFLLRDKLKSEISRLLKINSALYPNAMTAEQKASHIAELRAELDKAERIEAACVEALIAEGAKVHHRPNISILAVLSLRVAD